MVSGPATLENESRLVWSANVDYQILKKRDYAKIPILEFVNSAYKFDPKADPNALLDVISKAEAAFNRRQVAISNPNQVAMKMTESLIEATSSLPNMRETSVSIGKVILQAGFDHSRALEDSLLVRMIPGLGAGSQTDFLSMARFNGIYAKTFDLAISNQNARTVVDKFLGPLTNNSRIQDSPGEIRQKNVDFDQDQNIRQSLSLIKVHDLQLSEIKQIAGQQFGKLHSEIQRLSKSLPSTTTPNIFDYNGARVSFSILSLFTSFSDPKVARAIEVAGNSIVNVSESLSKFSSSELTGIALSGNIVKAVFGLVSLLDSSSSAEQLILEQLGELRKEVRLIRQEMHERFDRIDTALLQIYDNLELNFDHLRKNEKEIYREALAIKANLLAVSLQISRLDTDLRTFLKDLYEKDFEMALAALDHERFHNSEIDRHTFETTLDTFRLYATRLSRAAILTGNSTVIDSLSSEDSALYMEVAAKIRQQPIENNINILAQVALKFGNSSLSVGLPNASTWAVSSNSYLTMIANNWTEYGKATPVAGIDVIIETGEDLRQGLRSIFFISQNNKIVPNIDFLDALFQKGYKSRSDSLFGVVAAKRKKYEDDNIAGLSLWGTADQAIPVRAANFRTTFADAFQPMVPASRLISGVEEQDKANGIDYNRAISAPDNITNLIPKPYLAAYLLGLGRFHLTYETRHVANTSDNYLRVSGEFVDATGGRKMFDQEVLTDFRSGLDVAPFQFRNGIAVIWGTDKGLRVKFVDIARDVLSKNISNDNIHYVSKIVAEKLVDHQKVLDQRIREGIVKQSDSDLFSAFEQLTGAKLLIEGYLTLGLSHSFQENAEVRSSFCGIDRLFDATALLTMGSFIHDPESKDVVDARRVKVFKILSDVLVRSEPEEYPIVESTLNRLHFLQFMQMSAN